MSDQEQKISDPETVNTAAEVEIGDEADADLHAVRQADAGEEKVPPPSEPSAEDRIAALEAELAKANDNLLRALADAENTRSRTRRELESARKFAVEPLAKDLLTALDHLGRACAAVPAEALAADETLKALHVGVEMTEKELLKAFEKHRIVRLIPKGDPFDPNLHQALQHVEGTQADSGTVIEVVAPGYTMQTRLLRAAMVLVAK